MARAEEPSLDPTLESRLSLVRLSAPRGGPTFADDVRAGLSSTPKTLQPKYFYDELGSILFEAICALPEYYVARAESAILEAHAEEIVSGTARPLQLVELGSGSSTKTRLIIEALLARQGPVLYSPIDISESAIRGSCEGLLTAYPELTIHAFVGDYLESLAALPDRHEESEGGLLVLFLGSTIGNLTRTEGEELLRAVRGRLAPGDGLLLGTDLQKPNEILIPAYDDPLGVTAAFNLNLLVRINRELGGEFDLRRFSHRAIWNEEEKRVEMHMVSREDQRVAIRALDLEAVFRAGETIWSESSHKFDAEGISRLAAAAGFAVERRWSDPDGYFSSNLLVAV